MATKTARLNDGINAISTENSKAFVRPQGPPKIWKTVDGFKKVGDDKKPVKFVIQEIPEDRHEDVLDLLCTYFLADEPSCRSLNAVNDPVFVKECRNIWKDLLAQGISIAAFVENPNGGKPEIAGINVLVVESKNGHSKPENIQSTSLKTLINNVAELVENSKAYDVYNIDKYLYAFGLSVHPSYRGQYLGLQLLNTRINVGREYNLPVTLTYFSSPISQREAERANFEVLLEKDYDQMFNEAGNPAFPNINAKSAKIMARRID